jgi:hypothetical protein
MARVCTRLKDDSYLEFADKKNDGTISIADGERELFVECEDNKRKGAM